MITLNAHTSTIFVWTATYTFTRAYTTVLAARAFTVPNLFP